jgi:hypothetical protein
MKKVIFLLTLAFATGVWAQDKAKDECAALRLENAQLKVQLADLRLQFIQAQGALMQQQYAQVQVEKQQADAALKAEQDKQGIKAQVGGDPPQPKPASAQTAQGQPPPKRN